MTIGPSSLVSLSRFIHAEWPAKPRPFYCLAEYGLASFMEFWRLIGFCVVVIGGYAQARCGTLNPKLKTVCVQMVNLIIPDKWQQDAVNLLRDGKDVVVQAPTGAGKTYIFELMYESLKGQAVYTVPTRALANDKLAEWRAKGWDVGISTGDLAENLGARVVVATLETQKGRILHTGWPAIAGGR